MASGRPALGGLRAGRCRRDGGRADETTSPGARGPQEGGGGSSYRKEVALPCRWLPPPRWLRGGEAGEEPGSSPGGRWPLHCANLQAGWRRQPRPASAAGAAPPLASVPGKAAGSRFPLRRSWTAACWRPGQQAAASWSVFFPECSFISPSPLLSRTCSLSFSFHSFYPISACLPLLLPFSSFKLVFFLFPSLSPAPILFPFGPSYLVLLNFLISSDFFPWTLPCHVKMEVRHDWLSSSPHEGFEQMRLKSRPREPSPSLTRVGANFYSTVKQQDYSASVWLRRKDKDRKSVV